MHHGYCAHGSINNTTDRDRLSYLFSYSPADTRYWEAAGGANGGSPRLRLENDEANPVVYSPPPLQGNDPSPAIPEAPDRGNALASSSGIGSAMTEAEVEAVVREVTDEEVEHYHEYGWVMLRELVDPAFAAEMLRALYEAGAKEDPPALFPAGHPAKGGLEPFRSFMFSQRMSSNAARLVNRRRLKGVDVPLRWRQDIPVLKPKGQAPSTEPHGFGTGYHQAHPSPSHHTHPSSPPSLAEGPPPCIIPL